MKSKFFKRRGHIYAVVRKPESVAHLAPNSNIHAVHREFSRQLQRLNTGQIGTDITSPTKLKFDSLSGGQTFDASGQSISEEAFEATLNAIRLARGHYCVTEIARNGRPYVRKRKADPVRQFGVTVFPVHAMALSALEQNGHAVRPTIGNLARVLAECFTGATPYQLLAIAVHPEESMLHFHICYSVVDSQHQLLHDGHQLGQPARNFLGVGRISTLRLVNFGFWPAIDASDIQPTIAAKSGQFGARPLDLLLSETVDSFFEVHFQQANDPKVLLAYRVASDAYQKYASEVRATRLDVLIESNTALKAKMGALEAQIAAQQRDRTAIPLAPKSGIALLLEELSQILGHKKRGEAIPQQLRDVAQFLIPAAGDGWTISNELQHELEAHLVAQLRGIPKLLDQLTQVLHHRIRGEAIPHRLGAVGRLLTATPDGGWAIRDIFKQVLHARDRNDGAIEFAYQDFSAHLKAANAIALEKPGRGPELAPER